MVISGNSGGRIIASKTPELQSLAEDMKEMKQGMENLFEHIEEEYQILYAENEGNQKELHNQAKNCEEIVRQSFEVMFENKACVIQSYIVNVEKINTMATQAIES